MHQKLFYAFKIYFMQLCLLIKYLGFLFDILLFLLILLKINIILDIT